MPYVSVDGLRMHYEERGRPDGEALILLHNFLGTGEVWAPHVPALGARYRLILPDLRGHGRSDCPGGLATMHHRQFAADVAGLCRALGLERASFAGYSTGAMLLLTLGLRSPELPRALVLGAGTYFYGPELRAWWAAQTPETSYAARPEIRARHTALGPDHWRFLGEAWLGLGRHTHADDFPEAEELRGLNVPTLILHGDRDPFFPVDVPAALYRLLPDAELGIFPRTGHGLPEERLAWFDSFVLEFLARRLGSPPTGQPPAP